MIKHNLMPLLDNLILDRERILAEFARSGGTNVRVYGSVALRQETEQSDIDFLIDLTPEKLNRPFIIQQALVAEMRLDLEQLLNREVHIHVEEWLRPRDRQIILQSPPIPL